MNIHRFQSWASFFSLLLLGIGSPGFGIAQEGSFLDDEYEEVRGISLRESTKRILDRNHLKKLAGENPNLAIVQLDRLRTDSHEPTDEIALAIAEIAIRGGYKATAAVGAGLFLTAASETYDRSLEQAIHQGPTEVAEDGTLTELGLQNRAVEGLVDALEEFEPTAVSDGSMRIPGPLMDFEVSSQNTTDGWDAATFRYVGASTVARKKKSIDGAYSGVGAPVVAVRKGDLPDEPDFEGAVFPIFKFYYPLTAVLEFGIGETAATQKATLHLVDPRQSSTFELARKEYPLAIDIGAQFLVGRQETDSASAMSGILHAGKYMDVIGLYALEPLRTDQIPVVLVHGLNASPNTWEKAFDGVVLEPELRENFQFWLFAYPTGLPISYTANLLRNALVETVDMLDPDGSKALLRQMMLVGHSMGGLLVRMQVGDSDTAMWDQAFSKPPQEIDLPPEDLELLEEVLIFDSLPFVTRAVFFSAPHRGSKQAANVLGKVGASLVNLPDELKEIGQRIWQMAHDSLTDEDEGKRKIPDGVQALQPESHFIQGLDQVDVSSSVTYHTIVGDKGQGDTPDSSDGFVPYWSSHLDGAASEIIVPSGHSTHQHPEGIEELTRILYEHLESVEQEESGR